jgi:(5-formylfuran-3-yl)methyl phosphate synthase
VWRHEVKLLVSVVNEEEVAPAVEGGADIIDVKNPKEGTLGANFPHVIRRVRALTPRELEISATIGDASNLPGTTSLAALGASVCGVQYVKVGLLGTQRPQDAIFALQQVCRAVREYSPHTRIIAATYADAHKLNALPPIALHAVAAEAGVDGCLLDTALKGDGTLLTRLSDRELQDFVAQCQGANLLCALAGSLEEKDIPRVCKLGADIIGVRSAACQGGRITGRVDRRKVKRLKDLIVASASP